MRVGLVAAFGVEQPHPRRQLRWHIEHRLAGRDELLRQQRAGAGRAFDRPTPRLEPRRERAAADRVACDRAHPDLADELLVRVEHRRGVRSLVWIDSDDEHLNLLDGLPDGIRRGGQS